MRVQAFHENGKLAFEGSGSLKNSNVKFKIISSKGKVLADSEKNIRVSDKDAPEAADIMLRVRKLNDE